MVMNLPVEQRTPARRLLNRQRRIRQRAQSQFQRELRRVQQQYGFMVQNFFAGLEPSTPIPAIRERFEEAFPNEEGTDVPVIVYPLLLAAYATLYQAIDDGSTEVLGQFDRRPTTALTAQQLDDLVRERLALLTFRKQTENRLVTVLTRIGDNRIGTAVFDEIRKQVPRGRYNAIHTWAEIIANTESAYAKNRALLNGLRDNPNVDRVMALDNQTNFNDAECPQRDGRIFTLAEAERETAEEHINGTLEWIPIRNSSET